jgi:hypothetical protein
MSNGQTNQNHLKKEEKKERHPNKREHIAFVESWRDLESSKKLREKELGYFCVKCGHFNPYSSLQCSSCGSIFFPNL